MTTAAASPTACASCASCWRSPTRPPAASAPWRCGSASRSCAAARARSPPSEAHEVVQLLAEVPDLWDVKLDSSPTDCSPSRFSAEGSHEPIIEFVKKLTTKPVVGVGRFTSPDAMVGQIRRGVLDLIGGARPSIADPFLPQQDRRGPRAGHPRMHRLQHLHLQLARRRAGALHAEPDHRRGVAPRLASRAHSPAPAATPPCWSSAAGPAGLECALRLGRRGYEVNVAEAAEDIGGRLRFETRLPGLAAWGRVARLAPRAAASGSATSTSTSATASRPRRSSSSATRTSSSRPVRAGRACSTPRWRSRLGGSRARRVHPR